MNDGVRSIPAPKTLADDGQVFSTEIQSKLDSLAKQMAEIHRKLISISDKLK